MTMLDLLDQDVFWISGRGRRVELVDMHSEHRANLLAKLHSEAETLQRRCYVELRELGDEPPDVEPTVWLAQMPLVQALNTSLVLDQLDDLAATDDDVYRRAETLLRRRRLRAA